MYKFSEIAGPEFDIPTSLLRRSLAAYFHSDSDKETKWAAAKTEAKVDFFIKYLGFKVRLFIF